MSRPELSEVLAEVNRLRAERGLEPLDEMPKGVRGQYARCAVANALNDTAAVSVWPCKSAPERGTYFYNHVERRLPPLLGEFAVGFDDGAYPDLVA